MIKKEVKTQFGLIVREWRGRRGLSQEELAERAGLHRTYVSDVERGFRNVSLESIDRLAAALEISVSQLFTRADAATGGTSPAEAGTGVQMVRILFVEDREEDAELTIYALREAKFANHIQLVRSGEAALEALFGEGLRGDNRPLRPQLILLDLGLPRMSGQEVLRRIKADPGTRNIPVIVLTASTRDRDLMASRNLGADAYIVKPVDLVTLGEVTPRLKLSWALLHGPSTGAARAACQS